MPRFADLHCHPTAKLFWKFSIKSKRRLSKDQAHPWNLKEYKSNQSKLAKGKRATNYSQSDFARLLEGKVKIVFAALYPFEQGFLNKVNLESLEEMIDEMNFQSEYDIDEGLIDYDLYKKRGVPGPIAAGVLGLGWKRIKYIRSDEYDYFKELKREYDFILKKSGIAEETSIYIDKNNNGKPDEGKTDVKGTYWLFSKQREQSGRLKFKKWVDRNDILDESQNDIGVILTIEGISALSMYNQAVPVPKDELLQRINIIKNWDPPIFFITFSHHFNSNLAAHAHSFPDLLGPIDVIDPDQSKNMNFMYEDERIGISNFGLEIIKKLLSIKDSSEGLVNAPEEGHRILIDVKHMSATARRDLYEKVIEPYNANNQGENIPIIASHVGYAQVRSLQEMMDNYDNETNKSESPDGFNNWNINLSDEDTLRIVKSKGIIGLCFDQRIVGVEGGMIFNKKVKDSIHLLALNLKGFCDACRDENLHVFDESRYTIWDALCIGTDNDGGIDPVDDYPTAAEFPEFLEDLKDRMLNNDWWDIGEYGITDDNIDKALEKIAFDNAYQFLEKNWK